MYIDKPFCILCESTFILGLQLCNCSVLIGVCRQPFVNCGLILTENKKIPAIAPLVAKSNSKHYGT